MPERPTRFTAALLLMLTASLCPGIARAQAGPTPPCGGPAVADPVPAYPPPGQPPAVQTWSGGALGKNWLPPVCTGWNAPGFRVLAAIAGSFPDGGSETDPGGPLDRIGAISRLTGVRYWSVTDGSWQPLVTKATALTGPPPAQPRADFTAAEIAPGRELYYTQKDNRSSGSVTYRIDVLEAGPDRIRITVENVSSIKLVLLTLFGPGDLQSFHSLERRAPDRWAYYGLARTGLGASRFAAGHERSYENRAVAFYRFLAGIPTDRDPPVAP